MWLGAHADKQTRSYGTRWRKEKSKQSSSILESLYWRCIKVSEWRVLWNKRVLDFTKTEVLKVCSWNSYSLQVQWGALIFKLQKRLRIFPLQSNPSVGSAWKVKIHLAHPEIQQRIPYSRCHRECVYIEQFKVHLNIEKCPWKANNTNLENQTEMVLKGRSISDELLHIRYANFSKKDEMISFSSQCISTYLF